jgi:tetratricopeptide (TPR) repeat protein
MSARRRAERAVRERPHKPTPMPTRPIVRLDSTEAAAARLAGIAAYDRRDYDGALGPLRTAVRLAPRDWIAAIYYASTVSKLTRDVDADKVDRPEMVEAIDRLDRVRDATAAYLSRDFIPALATAGLWLLTHPAIRRFADAIPYYELLLPHRPDDATLNYEYWTALRAAGRFRDANAFLYEMRYYRRIDRPDHRIGTMDAEYFAGCPLDRLWRPGHPLDGKRLLIVHTEGLGDAIEYARYIPEIKRRWRCHVTLACQPSLIPLFRANAIADEYEAYPRPPDQEPRRVDYDVHAATFALPHVLGLEPPWWPPGGAYLDAPAADLGPPSRLRVGLCHSGNPALNRDGLRSIPLRWFRGLTEIPGAEVWRVTKGPTVRRRHIAPHWGTPDLDSPVVDLMEGAEGMDIVECQDRMDDFAATASLLRAMDVFVSIDSSPADLAGALGVPTLIIPPYVGDPRFGLGGETTPLYPSVRIFRAAAEEEWGPPIARVEAVVREMVAARSA